MIQFVSLEKGKSKDPEFQKGYLNLIDEEPTRSCRMQWKNLSASFRAILFNQKNQRRMYDLPFNYATYAFSAATAFCAFM
jgi:hypothetical protein